MAGTNAAGQKATPPKERPKLVRYPTTAYRAAHKATTATSKALIGFVFLHLVQVIKPVETFFS